MKIFVTGGAGFIGSSMCDSALERGHVVVCFDNFSTGKELFIKAAQKNQNFEIITGDIEDIGALTEAAKGASWTLHFAANADVRHGFEHPRKDLDVNTVGTWNVVEASRRAGVRNILFTSTGSVYGEPKVFPTVEDSPFPVQTSLYGASKLAGEGILAAYAHGFGMTSIVFRLVSILGPRYTHGHVFDFMKKLSADPLQLNVLGNGNQLKSYLHVEDLLAGFWKVMESGVKEFEVFNIGHSESLHVRESVELITKRLGLSPRVNYQGGERGWIGDSPRIELNTSKLRALGWEPKRSLADSVNETVDYLRKHSELLIEG